MAGLAFVPPTWTESVLLTGARLLPVSSQSLVLTTLMAPLGETEMVVPSGMTPPSVVVVAGGSV